jgi:hypothetical protein
VPSQDWVRCLRHKDWTVVGLQHTSYSISGGCDYEVGESITRASNQHYMCFEVDFDDVEFSFLDDIVPALFQRSAEDMVELWLGVSSENCEVIGLPINADSVVNAMTICMERSMIFPALQQFEVIRHYVTGCINENDSALRAVTQASSAMYLLQLFQGQILMQPLDGSDTIEVIASKTKLSRILEIVAGAIPDSRWDHRVHDHVKRFGSKKFCRCSFVPIVGSFNSATRIVLQLKMVAAIGTADIVTAGKCVDAHHTLVSDARTRLSLSCFQVWLRARGLRGLSRKAGAYYQLTSAPNVLRILYGETTAIQSLLKSAVYEYVECCACTFQCSSSVHDLSYLVQNSFESEIWIITSFSALQGIKDRVFAPLWNSVKCVVFAHLHEAAKTSDILSVMPASFKLVDVCLFPVSVSSTIGANSEPSTKWRDTFEPIDISAASAGADVDAMGHLKDWICRRKLSIPPWSLFCSKLVVFRRIAEDLYQIIMNYNSLKKNVVRVEKLLPCSGVTTILRTVAWKISTSHPGVKCFFVVTGHDGCMGDRQTDVRPSGEDLMLLLEHVAGLESHGECGHSHLTSSSCVQVQPDIVLN